LLWALIVLSGDYSAYGLAIPGSPLEGLGGARNPFGLEGHLWVADAGWVILPLLPLCMLASAVSLVLRYRRSGGEVRQAMQPEHASLWLRPDSMASKVQRSE
jgi:hypothetical protein